MGIIRKTASVSTLGAVSFNSRREAQAKQALAGAKLAKAQTKLAQAEQKALLKLAGESPAPSAASLTQPGASDPNSATSVAPPGVQSAATLDMGQITSPEPVAAPFDLADQLRKLADLKEDGILTQDEFDAKKAQLLSL